MECKVWSVECKVWRVECKVLEYGVRSVVCVECRMWWSVACEVWSAGV